MDEGDTKADVADWIADIGSTEAATKIREC